MWIQVVIYCLVAGTYASAKERIVNGDDADIRDFPYQVSVQYGPRRQQWCGGSIINKKYILTAAHCLEDETAESFSIRAGSTDRTEGGQLIQVKSMVSHPDYVPDDLDFDIAVLELSQELVFNDNVQPVEMNTNSKIPEGSLAWVTGWGDLKEGEEKPPTKLRKLQLPTMTNGKCLKYIPGDVLTDNMMCAGYVDGTADSCQGDSGGPLVLDGKQIGVVSMGVGCAKPGFPGLYARVSRFIDFVKTNSKL